MTPISSKVTFFCKRVFPVIWFGLLLFIFMSLLFSASGGGPSFDPQFLIVPVLMAISGYWIMKKWCLVLLTRCWMQATH